LVTVRWWRVLWSVAVRVFAAETAGIIRDDDPALSVTLRLSDVGGVFADLTTDHLILGRSTGVRGEHIGKWTLKKWQHLRAIFGRAAHHLLTIIEVGHDAALCLTFTGRRDEDVARIGAK
jgi:hypothetical protein